MRLALQRGILIGLAMVLAAVAILVLPSPALAKGYADCKANRQACLFEDPGEQGSQYAAVTKLGKYELDWWNGDNEISSVVNFTPYCLRLYDNDGWTGTSFTVPKFTGSVESENAVTRERLEDDGFDNETESFELYRC